MSHSGLINPLLADGLPDLDKVIPFLRQLFELAFGKQHAAEALRITTWILLVIVALALLWVITWLVARIKRFASQNIVPLIYNAEQRRRAHNRRHFAEHIEQEIRLLNSREDWKDNRFAELEGEVEATGRFSSFFGIPVPLLGQTEGLRRERSLSEALLKSAERLILLEGDPGSGKSTALRHLAYTKARAATHSRSARSIIPIYINLKNLVVGSNTRVDRALIERLVLDTLNRPNDRDIAEFLEDEFDLGVKAGTWLFLFDSFDEIPAILSSTDADSAINAYAQAIWDFLNGMTRCRGIIASRLFRGPRQLGWPRFQIVPLSSRREAELVRNSGLKKHVREDLFSKLAAASSDLQMMGSNPMFLGLLCEHMRAGQGFPTNSHTVFETYVNTRLHRDEYRVQQRFQVSINQLRDTAEAVAFCMSADNDLGLNPARTSLSASLTKFDFSLDDAFSKVLDALAFIKLAQSESDTGGVAQKNFTFAHRRFQEYFSTRVVLRNPGKVNPRMLLTDARWRETAVVLCQTRQSDALAPLLSEAAALLSAMSLESRHSRLDSSPKRPFAWPLGCLHLLGLLQDGFAGRLAELPNSIRELVGRIITAASENGILPDRKWAMEVAGCVLESDLFTLTRASFSSPSRWLRDAALRQVGRLADVPKDIAGQVRSVILQMAFEGRLRKDRRTVRALLSRFPDAGSFLHVEHIAEWLPWVDLILLFVAASATMYSKISAQHAAMSLIYVILAAVTIRIWAESGFSAPFGRKASLRGRNGMSGKMIRPVFLLALEGAVVARLLLVQTFTFSDSTGKTHFGPVILVTPALAVCTFWGPAAALTLTANGTGVIRGFFPVVLPYVKRFLKGVKSTFEDKDARGFLGAMVGLVGVGLSAIFGLGWLFGKLAAIFPEFSAWVRTHALTYLGLAALAVATVGLTVYVVVFLLDRSRAKRFILNARGSCNLHDVLAALEHFRLNSSRVWLLREIRRGNLIEVDATVEADLKSFIASYERDLDRSRRRWGRDALDEFSMMLEQIHGRRNAPAVIDPYSLVDRPYLSNSPGTIQTTWAAPQN